MDAEGYHGNDIAIYGVVSGDNVPALEGMSCQINEMPSPDGLYAACEIDVGDWENVVTAMGSPHGDTIISPVSIREGVPTVEHISEKETGVEVVPSERMGMMTRRRKIRPRFVIEEDAEEVCLSFEDEFIDDPSQRSIMCTKWGRLFCKTSELISHDADCKVPPDRMEVTHCTEGWCT